MELDKLINYHNLKTLLTGEDLKEERYWVLEIFVHYNEQMETVVSKEYAPGTLERYKTSLKHTKAFICGNINWKIWNSINLTMSLLKITTSDPRACVSVDIIQP
jgi:hypothetical protein